MLPSLDINNSNNNNNNNNNKLRKTPRKFEKGLFGGGLGKFMHYMPVHIELKPGVVSYKRRYYNISKAYEYVAMKEIQCMVDI